MSDLTVEPVDSITEADLPTGVDAPDYILYGGKGGVGKTTCAAATGIASARNGTSTLVVSTDPAHSLSDILEREVPATPTQLRDDIPLYAVEIDPETAADGLFNRSDGPRGDEADHRAHAKTTDDTDNGAHVGDWQLDGLDGLLGRDGHPLAGGAMPGADEAAAIEVLMDYLDDDRFERVIVDTAPTGHTLRLLELPDVMDSMIGRLLAFRESISGIMDHISEFGDIFGADTTPNSETGFDDLRTLSTRIERLRAVLEDPARTDFRVVMVPEVMSVEESQRLITQLEDFNIPVQTLVVNRVSDSISNMTDIETDQFVAPNTDDCEFCQRRWRVQRTALDRAQSLFRGREVKRIPLFADPVRGDPMLAVVAACLE